MEHHLYAQGLIGHKSDLFSIGGMEDVGKEMDPGLRENITRRIRGYGYELFYDEDLIRNIETRYQIYRDQGDLKCFINVGGNDASFGSATAAQLPQQAPNRQSRSDSEPGGKRRPGRAPAGEPGRWAGRIR